MSFVFYNPNPKQKITAIDCTVRAISLAEDTDWHTAYFGIVIEGAILCDMPSSNATWHSYLRRKGYKRRTIPNTCPDCYTIKDFAEDNPIGVFILGTGSHVVTVIDGNYYDTWDSGDETPVYYWTKGE